MCSSVLEPYHADRQTDTHTHTAMRREIGRGENEHGEKQMKGLKRAAKKEFKSDSSECASGHTKQSKKKKQLSDKRAHSKRSKRSR